MRNFTLKKFRIVVLIGFLMLCLPSVAQTVVPDPVPFSPRLPGGSMRIKGDVMFVGNNILNRSPNPNDAFTGTSDNNNHTMEYINVAPTATPGEIFSSSSASLVWPTNSSCYRVAYAGLYWASIYPFERSNSGDPFTPSNGAGDNARNPFNQVKIKLPLATAYTNITADQTIFDGFGYYFTGTGTPLSKSFKDCPVVCFKDVTSIVQGLADPTGVYTVANIRATKGTRNGGSAAGWVLVIIYENPEAATTSKFISIFDGYSGVGGNASAPINISGFTTLPSPFDVKARLGIGALEGDLNTPNDGLGIKANSTPGTAFTPLSSGSVNPTTNFFNSTISNNNQIITTRTPASTNTLGFDLDMFTINNPPKANGQKNSVIPNGETGAQLKLTTSGDGYGAFLATFAVEVIEPKIVLTKTVKNPLNGADIAGTPVGLNTSLYYDITYQNKGNDSAQNFTIRDVLPVNTIFEEVVLPLPPGVTYTFPTPGTILFNVSNNAQIVKDGGAYTIRIKVRVASDCSEFTDHCSNIIQNSAYATYRGIENTNVITDDPSVSTFDCAATPGPVNFLANVSACQYKSTATLCGPTLVLTAGAGYPAYAWYRKDPSGDVLIGNSQSVTVSAPGEYYVINTPTPPCIGIEEHVTVTLSTSLPPNPLIAQADKTNICANNGIVMTNIFLCGADAERLLSAGSITGTASWYKLNTAACNTALPANCPHNGCPEASWTLLQTGTTYTANATGEYRLVINNQGCQAVYYFNVDKSILNPKAIVKDRICGSNGEIRVTNIGSGYEYQFINQSTGAILQPYSSNDTYIVTADGTYYVEVRQIGSTDGCVYPIGNLGMTNASLNVNITVTDKTCSTVEPASITLQPVGLQFVNPTQQYKYTITGPSTHTSPWINNTNPYTFDNNLGAGTYTINVITNGTCVFNGTVTINDYSNPQATAVVQKSITCDPGVIKITGTGGEAPYSYMVYSKNGVVYNPAQDYFSDGLYEVTAAEAGTYVFLVVDANGCEKYSNAVTIGSIVPTVTSSFVNPKCVGDNNGSITVSATGTGITYELTDSSAVVTPSTTGNFVNLAPGTYTVDVIQTIGLAVCRYPYTFTLVPATAITAPTPTVTAPLTCVSNATIAVGNASGGTGPYEYSINGTVFGSAQTFPNLPAGTYRVTVKDANGCTFQTAQIVIAAPPAITAINVVKGPVTCPALTSNVTLTATGGTGSFTYAITAPASAVASNTTGVFNNLAPNTYSVLVTDSYGCTRTGNFTVDPITQISVIGHMMKPVACIGTATGAIRFTLAGFAPNYNYSITPSAGGTVITPASATGVTQNPIFFNNIAAGTYTITVTDPITNCTATTAVTVTAPTAALAVTTTLAQPTCTQATGSVTANVTGGWGNNRYTITGPSPSTTPSAPQSSPTFANLVPGAYTITVTDLNGNGCTVTSASFTIQADGPPAITVTGSDLCLPGTSITVEVTAGTGRAPYQFSLNGAAYAAGTVATGTTYNNLPAGTYTITVKDANNCTNTTTITRTINPVLTASTSLFKGITCLPAPANARIDVTIGGGQASYDYEVTTDGGTTYSTPVTVTGSFAYSTATAGNYQFRIKDAAGCTVTTPVRTVAPLVQPEFAFGITTDVLCNGASTGALTVNIDTTKGLAPHTFTVTNTSTVPPTALGTQTTGLPAGIYEVVLTDANGCTVTHTEEIEENDLLTFTTFEENIQCIDDPLNPGTNISAGKIIVQAVTGGEGPYTYELTNNFGYTATPVTTTLTTNTFIILNYGIYEVVITDTNGCTAVKSNIIMTSPPDELDIDVTTIVPATCTDGGSAIVEAGAIITGTSYQFAILETNTAPYAAPGSYKGPDDPLFPRIATFDNLTPGATYTFVVYDSSNHCYYFEPATIPAAISDLVVAPLVVNNVACNGAADGTAAFNFTVGTGTTSVSYQVYKSQSNEIVSTAGAFGTVPVTGGVGSGSVTDLPPGSYYIEFEQLTGNVGCKVASQQFTISESPILLAITANATEKDNDCTTDAGQVVITGLGGKTPYSYQLVPAGDPQPATWVSGNTFNRESGSYDAYIRDANNCIQTVAVNVLLDAMPEITAAITPGIQCTATEGGFSIDITRIAGDVGPYTYSLNGGAFESLTAPFTYTDLASGTYSVTIKDGNGCTFTVPVANDVIIYSPLALTAQPTVQPACADNDGEIEAEGDGGSGNYTYELAGPVTVTPQPSPLFTGLSHGTYTVTITDTTTGCDEDVTVTLEDPIEILPGDITFDKVDVTCNGESDGVIDVHLAVTNTDIPYTYSLNGGTPQTSPQFTGLAAATYTIDVTSGKGCTEQITVAIDEPSQLAIDVPAIVVTPFACDPADNTPTTATITFDAVATTGTAPYKYSIDGIVYNDAPDNTFEIVDTGAIQTITLHLMDDHGCEVTQTVTLNPLPVMAVPIVTQVTEITCSNPEEITLAVTGGSGEYRFELLPDGTEIQEPGAGVSSQNFDLTAPGTYVFRVTDIVTGCEITTVPYVINEYDLIEVTATASTPISCFTSTDGTITIDVQNYTAGPYDYEVLDGTTVVASGTGDVTVENPFTITGVPSGNLTVRVEATGTPFCDAVTDIINVGSPADVLTAIAVQTGSVQCTDDQGEITASATGGWGGYEYQLVNTTTSLTVQVFGTNNLFTGLPAGTYELTVRDSGGCDNAVDTVILAPIAPITAAIPIMPRAVLCFGDQTVTIEATPVANGQGTYEYVLNTYDATGTTIVSSTGAQLSPVFLNNGAGIYSITVTDGWNCGPVETNKVTVTEPGQLIGTLSLTNELSCLTGAELTIGGLGGTPPYQFSTDGGTVYNLANNPGDTYLVSIPVTGAGSYQYHVTDANGCTAVLTNGVTIPAVPTLELELDLDAALINCSGETNADIYALATGGLGNYQYSLLNAANAVIAGPNTTGEFENLGIGTYYVRVNSDDCQAIEGPVVITEPDPLVVDLDIDNILCFDGPNSTNGRLTVNVTGGTAPIQYAISPNLNQFFNSNVFYPLEAGDYVVIIQDANGCYDRKPFTITKPDEIQATLVNVTDEACLGAADGSINVSLTGGTGTYEISTDDITYIAVTGSSYTLTGLPSGLTTVYVKDQNGCSLNPPMEQPILPGVDMAPEATVATTCVANSPNNDVTITIIPGADPANITYSIDNTNWQSSNVFTDVNLAPGTYTAYARHIVPVTNLTCIQTDDFVIDLHTAIAATASITQTIDCYGDTGEITINVTPGSGSGTLEYAVGPAFTYDASNVFSGLVSGTYDFKVRDEIGCEFDITGVLLDQPLAPLTAAETHTNEICLNAADGSITVTPADGTGPYEITIDGGTTYTVASPDPVTFDDLAPDDYTVGIRDANGCIYTFPAAITITPGVDLQPTFSFTQTCEVIEITATVNAAIATDIDYYIDGVLETTALPAGPIVRNDLTVGSHTFEVRHDNGCSETFSFTVAPVIPFDIAGSTTSTTPVLCFGESTGTATLTITGGTGAFTYAISPDVTPRVYSAYQASNTFTDLATGSYVINVKDALGCESESTIIIVGQPAAALAATETHTHEICLGANDGTITITPTMGTGTAPYEITIDGGTTYTVASPDPVTFDDLVPDDYTVEIRDANGCIYTFPAAITITPGVDLQPTFSFTQTCEVIEITATVNPAIANDIDYYIDGVLQTSALPAGPIVRNDLTAGLHTFEARHDNGCAATFSFTVAPVIPFDIAGSSTSATPALCFGEATGSATLVITGGTGAFTYAISPDVTPRVYSAYQASNTFTDLAFGNYVINVKDALGCESESTVIIVGQPAAALAATEAHTHEICLGADDGTITITPTTGTGTAPYEVRINGGAYTAPSATAAVFTVAPGSYTVDVRDANGCIYTFPAAITINPGVDLQPTFSFTQTCEVIEITATVNPAIANDINYYIDGVLQTSALPAGPIVRNDLTAGLHTFEARHDNGCPATFDFTVAPVVPINMGTAVTSSTPVVCFGDPTGSATIVITGGTAPLSYAISPDVTPRVYGPYQASNTFTGLVAGNYIINVKDALGCESATTAPIQVVGPNAALTATTPVKTDETCAGLNNGTITVTPTAGSGTAPYRVSINNGATYTAPGAGPFVFNNLAPNPNYQVIVMDANNCTYTVPAAIAIAPGVNLQATVTATQVCDVVTVVVNVNPAVAGQVQYSLDGSAPQTSNTFVGVLDPAVPHSVTVTHANTCSQTRNVPVSPTIPILFTATDVITTDVLCYGNDVGTITANASGGTGPLQYAITWNIWPNPIYSSSNVFTDLLADENPAEGYTIWVKDAMGCVEKVEHILIFEPDAPLTIVPTTIVNESCLGAHDGSFYLQIAGGTPPYSTSFETAGNFQPYNAGVTPTYSNIYGNNTPYEVYVRDANGCYAKAFVKIERGVNLVPGVTTVLSCVNNQPVNTVTATLNTIVNNVEYRLVRTSVTPNVIVQDFDPNKTWNLDAGTYTLTAQHINGCEKDFSFTVQPRTDVQIDLVTVVDAKCNAATDGTITVQAQGGTGGLTYGISPDYVMTGNPVFTGLAAGTYTVRAQDIYGCYAEENTTIQEPDAIEVGLVGTVEEACIDDNNAEIHIVVIGGGTAPYASSLSPDGPFIAGQEDFLNLDGGTTYTVYVQDANGCIGTLPVVLQAPMDINASAEVAYDCEDSTVTIVNAGNINPSEFTYAIIAGPKGNIPPQTSNVFANLEDGAYTVEVTHTALGCTDTADFSIVSVPGLAISLSMSGLNQFTATVAGGEAPYTYTFEGNDVGSKNTFTYFRSGVYEVTVTDSRGCTKEATIEVKFIDIILPDVTTPDGDGQNDTWSPGNTQNYPNINSDIFDRYGRKLATLRQGESWDGTYEGTALPTGDYWFLVRLGDAEDRSFVGHFTIYR